MSSFKAQKIQYSFRSTATSGGTLTLVFDSELVQIFTGASSHTLKLPDATTMQTGWSFTVINTSTGAITIQNNGASTIATVGAGSVTEIFLTANGTANGTWAIISAGAAATGGLGSQGPGATKTANYTIVSGDSGGVINVDTSGGPKDITLPAPSNGFNVTIKDATGAVTDTNFIRVLRSSSSLTIDGEVNDDLIHTAFSSISYISDGTNWFRISSYV